jgi:hypothetical protein
VAFFGGFGDEIQFHDAADLERKWRGIDLSVPGRTEGRKSYHRERYCLALYLRTLAHHSLLPLPIRVVKGEAPDFLLVYTQSGVQAGNGGFGGHSTRRRRCHRHRACRAAMPPASTPATVRKP